MVFNSRLRNFICISFQKISCSWHCVLIIKRLFIYLSNLLTRPPHLSIYLHERINVPLQHLPKYKFNKINIRNIKRNSYIMLISLMMNTWRLHMYYICIGTISNKCIIFTNSENDVLVGYRYRLHENIWRFIYIKLNYDICIGSTLNLLPNPFMLNRLFYVYRLQTNDGIICKLDLGLNWIESTSCIASI